MESPRIITQRNLPHWQIEGSTYFVTFRLANGRLDTSEREIVLSHLLHGDARFYRLAAAVVMPDHSHLLIRPMPPYTLSRVMKGIKGVSARLLNQRRGTSGQVWQDESWDRIVRDWDEFQEKLSYIIQNPVRAGLVQTPENYPALFRSNDI